MAHPELKIIRARLFRIAQLPGEIAMCVLQDDLAGAKEIACSVKITFPYGSEAKQGSVNV